MVGGGAGAENSARSLFAPSEFLHGPTTVPRQRVTTRPVAARLINLLRVNFSRALRREALRWFGPRAFFFDMEFSFLATTIQTTNTRSAHTAHLTTRRT